jgi:hypothetical protein
VFPKSPEHHAERQFFASVAPLPYADETAEPIAQARYDTPVCANVT